MSKSSSTELNYLFMKMLNRMHCEVESFIDWISPSPIEDEIRGLIVAQITKVVKVSFADAEVYPFGSYQTKLYLPLGCVQPSI